MSVSSLVLWTVAPLALLGQSFISAYCMANALRQSILRPISILLVIILARVAYQTCQYFSTSSFYNALIAVTAFLNVFHHGNLLMILRVDASDLDRVNKQYYRPEHSNFRLALEIALATRGVRTPWLTKNCPQWSAYYCLPADNALSASTTRRPAPPRLQFLLRQTAIVSWCILVLDLINATSPPAPEEMFPPGAEFRYLDASSEEWITRISTSLITWFFMVRVLLTWLIGSVSIVAVGFGLADPEDFPPFFGSMWNAYTLRNYWG
jgi:hypothetical protein